MQESATTHVEHSTYTDSSGPPKPQNPKKKFIFRAYQIIWYVLGVLEAFIGFRFVFKLLGANQASPFIKWVYDISNPLVAPFRGIFPTPTIEGAVVEWVSLVAMAVYAVAAYAIVYFLQLVKPVEPEEVEKVINNP